MQQNNGASMEQSKICKRSEDNVASVQFVLNDLAAIRPPVEICLHVHNGLDTGGRLLQCHITDHNLNHCSLCERRDSTDRFLSK